MLLQIHARRTTTPRDAKFNSDKKPFHLEGWRALVGWTDVRKLRDCRPADHPLHHGQAIDPWTLYRDRTNFGDPNAASRGTIWLGNVAGGEMALQETSLSGRSAK